MVVKLQPSKDRGSWCRVGIAAAGNSRICNPRITFFIVSAMIGLALQLWNLLGFAFINPMSDCDFRDSSDKEALGFYLPKPLHLNNDIPTSRNKMKLTQSNVAIFVLSRRYGGLEIRNAIRETWAKGHDNVYFVLGQDCRIHPQYRGKDEGGNEACQVAPQPLVPKIYEKLAKEHLANVNQSSVEVMNEAETHRDLLIMDVVDVYRTLPQKIKAVYTFVEESLPNVQWIVKVDDDFFVRVDKFAEYLQNNFNATELTLVGNIVRRHRAFTDGKWKEVPQFPQRGEYPPFPLGSYGHAVSRPVAKYLMKNQEVLFNYQGEDVSIGIWLNEKEGVKFVDSNVMSNEQRDCFDPSKFVVGHDIKPAMMNSCYEKGRDKTAMLHDTNVSSPV
jgi:hypothetical protein